MSLLQKRLDGLKRFNQIEPEECDAIDGFVEPLPNRYRCVIKNDAFNRIFLNKLQRELVMQELLRLNYIKRSRSRDEQVQFIWPDDKRRRSLEINWVRTKKQ